MQWQTLAQSYAALDWAKSNNQLAAVTGRTVSHIHKMRKIYAPDTAPSRKPKRDWAALDWSKSNAALAKELGLQEGYVKIQRSKTLGEVGKRNPAVWATVDWSRADKAIATDLGYTVTHVKNKRKQLN